MARPNFLNENSGRCFPFLKGVVGDESASDLAQLGKAVVLDFGAIMGAASHYQEGLDSVYLARVARRGSEFRFYFRSTAPGVENWWLVFSRMLGQPDYATEYKDAERVDLDDFEGPTFACAYDEVYDDVYDPVYCEGSESTVACPYKNVHFTVYGQAYCANQDEDSASVSTSASLCENSARWSGYLTTGDLESLTTLLPANGDLIGQAEVEPALVANFSNHFVRGVGLANLDRTRAESPDGCLPFVWSPPPLPVYIVTGCMAGDIRFEAGYNVVLEQNNSGNEIVIGADPGAGAGVACGPIPLSITESPPEGRSHLDGGLGCDEVIRSVNGVGGQTLNVVAGTGVSISPDPLNHRIKVSVNLRGLKACGDFGDEGESATCPDPETPDYCGPA